MSKRKISPMEAKSAPLSLPAAAEAEWRFSYKFAGSPAMMTRLSLGAGLFALLLFAARIW